MDSDFSSTVLPAWKWTFSHSPHMYGWQWLELSNQSVLCVSVSHVCAHTNNLQFDGLAIQLNGADLKVHANGADIAFCVGVILQKGTKAQGQAYSKIRKAPKLPTHFREWDRTTHSKTQQKTGLSYSRVTNEQELEEIVTKTKSLGQNKCWSIVWWHYVKHWTKPFSWHTPFSQIRLVGLVLIIFDVGTEN